MEFLIITAIQEFEKEIKALLKKSGVVSFSYTPVTGYKDQPDQQMQSNWFASEVGESPSVLFYVITEKEKTQEVIGLIDEFNSEQETASAIHIVALDIINSNKI